MPDRSPIVVGRAIRQTNSDRIMERARETSPRAISPRAIMRALQPVRVGERSILPGRMTDAFGP
jgi:hypothetical protein